MNREIDNQVQQLRCMGRARRVIRDTAAMAMIELGASAEYMTTCMAAEQIMADMEQRIIDAAQPSLLDMMPIEVNA